MIARWRWAWRISWVLLRLVLVVLSPVASVAAAQVVDATQWHSGTVTLSEGWREHDGDNLAWARPGFDDSGWQQVDLDELGAAQPGWRWYRLHLKLGED